VQNMEAHLKTAENEREKLALELNRRLDECNALKGKLRNEDQRRETLEEKLQVRAGLATPRASSPRRALQEVRRQLHDTDAKLERERERTLVVERQAPAASAAAFTLNVLQQHQLGQQGQQQFGQQLFSQQQFGQQGQQQFGATIAGERPVPVPAPARVASARADAADAAQGGRLRQLDSQRRALDERRAVDERRSLDERRAVDERRALNERHAATSTVVTTTTSTVTG